MHKEKYRDLENLFTHVRGKTFSTTSLSAGSLITMNDP